jgi:glycosyltransferase involved in cell wall biosynthesis
MVGQLPLPITGESKVNEHLYNLLKTHDFMVNKINTCIVADVGNVGKFNLKKALKSLNIIFQFIFYIIKSDVVYFTPGQTKLGLLRFLPLVWMAKLLGKKIINHWHGYGVLGLYERYSKLTGFFLKPEFKNILLTQDLLQKLKSKGLDASNMEVVYNFSDYAKITPNKSNLEDKLLVLYLGGLMPEKGVMTYMDLAEHTDQFNLMLCGSGDINITSRAQSLSQQERLNFLGVVDGKEKDDLFAKADVFVLQTHYPTEGVPLAILEAMACGCAIITTAHNGIPETVLDAATFVKPKSIDSLYSALNQFDQNRELLHQMKKKAYLRSNAFSKSQFNSELLKIFKVNSV